MRQKIMLQDSEGKTWITNMTWNELIERIDHLEKTTSKLWDEKYAHDIRLEELEKPIRRQKIVDLLKSENVPRTWGWIQRRISVIYSDLMDAIGNQQVVPVKHGFKILYLIKNKELPQK